LLVGTLTGTSSVTADIDILPAIYDRQLIQAVSETEQEIIAQSIIDDDLTALVENTQDNLG
jgi:hypothetical protein